jgi:hypothetical protein
MGMVMVADTEIELLVNGIKLYFPLTNASLECIADVESLHAQVVQLRAALQWIVTDALYKPPEEFNWLARRYVDCAIAALAEDGQGFASLGDERKRFYDEMQDPSRC